MIKKEYIQPEVKEVVIKLPTILADSLEKSAEEAEESEIQSLDADFDFE
jgi:hypothetical protein